MIERLVRLAKNKVTEVRQTIALVLIGAQFFVGSIMDLILGGLILVTVFGLPRFDRWFSDDDDNRRK